MKKIHILFLIFLFTGCFNKVDSVVKKPITPANTEKKLLKKSNAKQKVNTVVKKLIIPKNTEKKLEKKSNTKQNDFTKIEKEGNTLKAKPIVPVVSKKLTPKEKSTEIPKVVAKVVPVVSKKLTPREYLKLAGENISKRNYSKAKDFFQKACDGGSSKGCSALGLMYGTGEGVVKNSSLAVKYYKKACTGGDAFSCLNLANKYYVGEGIGQDKSKAKELYRKACDGGEAKGCEFLKKMKNTTEAKKKKKVSKKRVYNTPLEREIARVVRGKYGNIDFSWKCKPLGQGSPYISCFINTSQGSMVTTCTSVGTIQCGKSFGVPSSPNMGVPSFMGMPSLLR